MESGAILPGTAFRWITAAAPQPMQSPPACHCLLRMVPSLAPQDAFTRDVRRAILSHTRAWLANPGARYPPGPVLEQLTAPTPGVRHALHRASALTEQLNDEVLDLALEPLRVLYPQTYIPPAGTSNRLGRLGLQRRVEAAHPGGVLEQWLTLRNPSAAQGHGYLHQLLLLPRAAPEHRWQNPYRTQPERRGAQSFPQPVQPALSPRQGPEALQQAPPLNTAPPRYNKGEATARGCRTGRHGLRSGGLDGGLRAPRPRYHGAQAVQTSEPHGAGVRGRGRHHGSRGGVAGATAAPRPLPRHAAPPAGRDARADGTPHGGAAIRRRGGAAGGRRGELRPPPRPGTDCGKHTRAAARCTPPVARHTLGGTRVWDAGDDTPPPGPQQGEALVLQTAGYQAILHGRTSWPGAAGLSGKALPGKGHSRPCPTSTASRGPPRPTICPRTPGRWQSCYTPSAPPTRGRNRDGSTPPALVWSPNQEEHLRAAWQGDTISATDVPDLHAGPITHARLAATPAVAQRGQQNPQWVVCMFSPADAHIVVCDPERLLGPKAVVCVADCTRVIVKALQEGEHHALLLQIRLKDNARAARPGVWPAAAHPADLELQLAVPTTVYHWLQAIHDLRWRGKPDRQISSTHW